MTITIDVKTKAVHGWDRRNPMARNSFGDATPGYIRGHIPPNYPVPAIRYSVTYKPMSVSLWGTTQRRWEDTFRRNKLIKRWYDLRRFK